MTVDPHDKMPSYSPRAAAKGGGAGLDAEQPIIEQAVRDEVRKNLPSSTTAFGLQVGFGAAPNAFIEKLTSDHIDKILDYTRKDKADQHLQHLV